MLARLSYYRMRKMFYSLLALGIRSIVRWWGLLYFMYPTQWRKTQVVVIIPSCRWSWNGLRLTKTAADAIWQNARNYTADIIVGFHETRSLRGRQEVSPDFVLCARLRTKSEGDASFSLEDNLLARFLVCGIMNQQKMLKWSLIIVGPESACELRTKTNKLGYFSRSDASLSTLQLKSCLSIPY